MQLANIFCDIFRYDNKTIKVANEYAIVVANAAPAIPHFGISIIFNPILTTKAINEAHVANMGLPMPDK